MTQRDREFIDTICQETWEEVWLLLDGRGPIGAEIAGAVASAAEAELRRYLEALYKEDA